MVKLTSEVKTLVPLIPFLCLSITGLLLLLLVAVRRLEGIAKYISLMGALAAFLSLFCLPEEGLTVLNYSFIYDGVTKAATLSIIVALLFTLLTGFNYEGRFTRKPEYYALLFFSSAGMILLAGGGSFISIFIALELTSLPLYILSAFMRNEEASFEAGVKYFLLGSFASAFFLMGIAFTFGKTGHVLLKDVKSMLIQGSRDFLVYTGFIFLITGLFFKAAVVPFHIWAPDVYQGAPSPCAGFMSVAVKASVFPVLIRLLNEVFLNLSPAWEGIVYVFSLLTIIWGSLLGIIQDDFKRLLAYSSIVHAGFILLALLNPQEGGNSAAFYIIIYTFMNIGAFGIVTSLSSALSERSSLNSYKGLFTMDPFLSLMLLIYLFSLAGIPPTAGFWAKFYIFKSALAAGYLLPVVIALLGAVVALYYYLRVTVYSFMSTPEENGEYIGRDLVLRLSLLFLSLAILYFGIYPRKLFEFLSVKPFMFLGK